MHLKRQFMVGYVWPVLYRSAKAFLNIERFQKISIRTPRRELEIPEGWGGGGADGQINSQMVQFDSGLT